MKLTNSNKKLSAVSLVEVMVVLGIVAATMVGGMRMAVSAYIEIKNNEIADYATGIMIQALEISKSPELVRATSDFGSIIDFDGSYSVEITEGQAVIRQESSARLPLESCDRDSVYYVNFQIDNGQPPIACLQLNVEAKPGLVGDYFEIEARILYVIENETTTKSIIGYRTNAFQTL